MTSFYIRLLGGFVIERDGTPLPPISSERVVTLLAYLLLHRDVPQPRQQIAFQLWPDTTDAQARGNLRVLLHQLRNTLLFADELLAITPQTLQWNGAAPAVVDIIAFDRAAQTAIRAERDGNLDNARAAWAAAVTEYRGDLLPENYDDWVGEEREALRRTYANALTRLTTLLEEKGDYDAALRYAERWVQFDPLEESAYIPLMRLRAYQGDRAGVKRTYDRLTEILQRELDVEPSAVTRVAYEQWRRWERAIPAVSDAPTLTLPPLPPRATQFIGRDEEVTTITELLLNPSYRLITLTGPGGMGKTRLALELAHLHQAAFQDGVLWMPLVTVQDPALLTTAVAEALGFRFRDPKGQDTQLQQYLRDRHMLVVLDNFEHLLEGVPWVSDLLQNTRNLTILATARVRLDLQEEWVWEVGGLMCPPNDSPHALESSEASQLFRHAMQRVQRGYQWDTTTDRTAVVQLCDLLEGMPLGLELAAAWGRVLSPADILQELERGLDFLDSTQRNLPERHRSLRAVFNHSWDLLAPLEQATLRRLSLFRSPFTREAAADVTGAKLAHLSALVDSSLLRKLRDGRFTIHEAVRQYAAERLEKDPKETAMVRDRHAAYFANWTKVREPILKSGRQPEAVAEITRALSDIRMAWNWSVAHGQWDNLRLMLGCFSWYHEVSGQLTEGLATFAAAVAALRQQGAPDVLTTTEQQGTFAFLLEQHGWYMARLGKTDDGLVIIAEGLRLAEACGDLTPLHFGHGFMAYHMLTQGRAQEARPHAVADLHFSRENHSRWAMSVSWSLMGWADYYMGNIETAAHELEQGLLLAREVGDPRYISFALTFLSAAYERLGAVDKAEQYLIESAELSEHVGDYWSEGNTLNMLGQMAQRQGDIPKALPLYDRAEVLFRHIGDPAGLAIANLYRGDGYLRLENGAAARLAYHEALKMEPSLQPRTTMLVLLGLAAVRAKEGNPTAALETLYVILPIARPIHTVNALSLYEALLQRLEAELPPAKVAELQRNSATRTMADLLPD